VEWQAAICSAKVNRVKSKSNCGVSWNILGRLEDPFYFKGDGTERLQVLPERNFLERSKSLRVKCWSFEVLANWRP
jgi:hypothetical protein